MIIIQVIINPGGGDAVTVKETRRSPQIMWYFKIGTPQWQSYAQRRSSTTIISIFQLTEYYSSVHPSLDHEHLLSFPPPPGS